MADYEMADRHAHPRVYAARVCELGTSIDPQQSYITSAV